MNSGIPADIQPVLDRIAGNERAMTGRFTLTELERSKLRALALKSTFFFCKVVLGFKDFEYDPHLEMCDFIDHKDWRRRMLLAPRGTMKSTVVRGWEIQQAMRNPNIRILHVMSSAALAEKCSRDVDAIFRRNTLLQYLFPECIPEWKEADLVWNLQAKIIPRTRQSGDPTFMFAGVGTKVVGMHFDAIILDDFIEMEAAKSDEIMRGSIDWAKGCDPLLESPSRDQMVVVGTRWSERDYYGIIMGEREQRTKKKLFRAKGDPRYVCMKRAAMEDGRPFWAQRFPADALAGIKAGLASDGKGGLYFLNYMNDPIDLENCAFDARDIREYRWTERGDIMLMRPEGVLVVPFKSFYLTMVVDPASTVKKTSDRSAISLVGSHPKGYRINVYAWRGRVTPDVLMDKIFGIVKEFRDMGREVARVAIEKVGSQENLLWWAKEKMRHKKMYIPLYWDLKTSRTQSKDDRVRGLAGIIAGGHWYTNKSASFLDTNEEMETYPNGAHVDWLDALAYQPQIWGLSNESPDVVDGEEVDEDEMEEEAAASRPEGYGG